MNYHFSQSTSAASKAAQDEPRQGSAGLPFIGPNDESDAYVVDIAPALFDLWSEHPTKIAQLELLAVYVGFIFVASQARSCQVVDLSEQTITCPKSDWAT